jgi:hypothetical protein
MLIDSEQCELRDRACPDCVVMALLSRTGRRCEIGEAEHRALRVLADAGLISPLRLRASTAGPADTGTLRKAS